MVLYTSCSVTQVHSELLALVGCGEATRLGDITIAGVTGDGDPSYLVRLDGLSMLGSRFKAPTIAGVDFNNWARSGIEGLVGWDLVRQLHFEMDGPKGLLKVF